MDETIYVGRKLTVNYILAVLKALENGKRVVLKARGRWINKAVNTVLATKNKWLPQLRIERVKIGTEYRGKKGVSTIEIRVGV